MACELEMKGCLQIEPLTAHKVSYCAHSALRQCPGILWYADVLQPVACEPHRPRHCLRPPVPRGLRAGRGLTLLRRALGARDQAIVQCPWRGLRGLSSGVWLWERC